MKKIIAKLLIIIAIFAIMIICNNEFIGQPLTKGYIYYIFLGVIMSLLVGIIINEKNISGGGAIAIYGANLTALGGIIGVLFTYNFVSVLGKTANDLYIFDKAILPGSILAIAFIAFGLAVIIFCLRKSALPLLLPYLVVIGITAVLIYKIYISCTQNTFTSNLILFHSDLRQIRDVVVISSIAYWGFVVYRVKHYKKSVLA